MEKDNSQNPNPADWRVLYRAAISETNRYEIAKRSSEAEEAIVERMRELFRETGAEAGAEREAMDYAMYALRAWKLALEKRTHAA
jgi:ornithine cyclodeaminase/alanine dehydrogenase-like protein (mu-crystallin family)